jgi:vancomycin resistance protein YoaR
MPGVSVHGVPVANASEADIARMLSAQHGGFLNRPVTLRFENESWQPSLDELGTTLNTRMVAQQALDMGRQGHPLTRLRELWQLWQDGIDITPRVVVDWGQLQTYLERISHDVETPPQDAALSVAAGKIITTRSASGVQMLVDETAHDIVAALQTLAPQEVVIRTRPLPPVINDEALREAYEEAQVFLSSTLVMTRSTDMWEWEPEKLAELLHIDRDGSRLVVDVDQSRLAREVEDLAQVVDSGSVEPRLRFEQGMLQIVEEGQDGWQVLQPQAVSAISATLHQSSPTSRTVEMPVRQLSPQITAENLGELGINELVGEGKSSFAGSAEYRITNIKAGAARFDGVLIAPGEEFSFNTQLGPVNAEHGFVEGYAVIGNRTQLEWGGGVCQNSTTTFRAAFWAGLPITERHAHPFYISWYDRFAYGEYGDGPGMDATIYTGQNDLKFVNDTDNWLLLQTDVDEANQVLTVQLYGTKPERRVEFEGPHISNEVQAPATPIYIDDPTQPSGTVYQSDVARNGRDIVVYRIIIENETDVKRESFFTRFKPWPNVYIRGTG